MEPQNEILETLESPKGSSPPTPPSDDGDVGAPAEVKPSSSGISDLEKKQRRAERFGVPFQLSEEERRTSRAERFGTRSPSIGSPSVGRSEGEKEEEDKRKARAERFGLTVDDGAKKKARAEKSTMNPMPVTPEEEEKRKARALRFSETANATTEANGANGKAKLELNVAIAETKQEA